MSVSAKKKTKPGAASKARPRPRVIKLVTSAAPSVECAPAADVPAAAGNEIQGAAADIAVPLAVTAAAPARAGMKLESSCVLRDSADLLFQLLSADFGAGDVLIDGSAVERVDTAGLQLLVAFARGYESRGRHIKWTAASAELTRSGKQLGLLKVLGLSEMLGAETAS